VVNASRLGPPQALAPLASRLQVDVQPIDHELTSSAMQLRPGVRWWWGVRNDPPVKFAACYLCGETVAEWGSWRPISEVAVSAILLHRGTHRGGRGSDPGDPADGMSPPASQYRHGGPK
jgi:hypothetical protein